MKIIVGLGNPGEKYQDTRHNLGFRVVEQLTKIEHEQWVINNKFHSQLAIINSKLILVKPQTYVNNSGMAVKLLRDFYKVLPEDIWVVQDDLDLPLGKIKIRLGGAAGGHHGVESIIAILGTDQFWRFRLGIKPQDVWEKQEKVSGVEKFVLESFLPHEKHIVKQVAEKTVEAMKIALLDGLDTAMNRFNQ